MSAKPNRSRRNLGLLTGAIGLSALGDWLAIVPLALHVQERGGSGIAIAALFIALWSPAAVLAGPAGLLADRLSPARLLTGCSLLAAALCCALAFTDALAPLLVLTALLGCVNAVAHPAEFALVPVLAQERELVRVNGHVEAARYAGFMLGPLLGGLLAAGGGTRLALLADAGTFLALAGVGAALAAHVGPHPGAAAAGRARDGIVMLARDADLRLAVGVVFVSLLFMTATPAAIVVFATESLDVGERGYGLLMALWTAGMAAGAMGLARRVPAHGLAAGALAAVAVQGAGIAAPTLWVLAPLAAAGYVVGGLAHGTKNVLVRTLIHERAPGHMRGRAYAAYNGLRNGAEIVALTCGGVLIATVGARWTLLLAGGLPVLVALAALLARYGRRAPVSPAWGT
ncbi:MAG TPA: MFS transporter [Solirubrobacteraceae bacterium]|nr:MFS transporter [Solirubrobacteraceae bacterium]